MDSRSSYGPVSGLSLGRVLRKPWSHLAGQVVGEPGRSRSAFGIRDGASRTSSRPTGCVGTEPCSPIPAWRVLNEAEEPPRPRPGTARCRRRPFRRSPPVGASVPLAPGRVPVLSGSREPARRGTRPRRRAPAGAAAGARATPGTVSNLVQQLVEAGWSTAPATPRTGAARRGSTRAAHPTPEQAKATRGQLPRSHRTSSGWRQMKGTAMPPRGRSVPAEPGADGRTTVAESGQRPGARTPPRGRRRRVGRWAGGVVVVALAVVGYSVAGALLRPGNDTIAQRLAEWGRDHHLNWAVTRLEQAQYQLNKPKAGGSLAGGIPTAAGEHDTAKAAAVPHSPVPAPLPP